MLKIILLFYSSHIVWLPKLIAKISLISSWIMGRLGEAYKKAANNWNLPGLAHDTPSPIF